MGRKEDRRQESEDRSQESGVRNCGLVQRSESTIVPATLRNILLGFNIYIP